MIQKSKYGMPPPENRSEFEHNIGLIYEDGLSKAKLENKESLMNFKWAVGDNLQKVNFLPNGRIDLLSINENLRLYGNTMHWMNFLPPLEINTNKSTENE
jgi:hypothetical protein